MRTILLIFLFILPTSVIFAQGTLQFKEKEITLKNLKANDIPTEVVFKFKNGGAQPVIITRVTPMNSEMKADWDKAPITPGKSSEIKISFNTTKMPVNFRSGVMIFLNNGTREEVTLSGNIIDNPAKPELLYQMNLAGLKFKSNSIQFDKIYIDQILSDTLYFFNTRTDSVTIGTNYLPSHLQLKAIPEKVAPGKKGTLIITFDAPKKNDYGYSYEGIILSLNNGRDYNNRINVTANVSENFGKLSKKELQNAPVATFEKMEISFGTIKPGEKANCDFSLKNTGKSDLTIRKTRASCGCTAVTLGQTVIAPGQSTVIRTTFDSSGKAGRQYKSITVITNDPKTPEQTLTITGDISK